MATPPDPTREPRLDPTTAAGRRPWRPRLLPGLAVLHRRGAVQLGADRPDAVVIAPAPPGLAGWLRLLDGTRGVVDLLRTGARLGLGAEDVGRLLEQLRRAGLLTPATTPAADTTIRLTGAGRLGRSIARLLARTDLGVLELVDGAPVDRLLYPRALGLIDQAAALHAELESDRSRRRRAGLRSTVGPRIDLGSSSAGEAAGPTRSGRLTIVASDHQEPDRLHTDALLRADEPHLLVRTSGDGVVVGPLVLPGRTACVRCTDLRRSETDRDWPALLSQLCRTVQPVDEPHLSWAAATAVTQALALVHRDRGRGRTGSTDDDWWPETLGSTVELTRDHRIERRRWTPHPACGCRWSTGGHPRVITTWIEDEPAVG